MLKEHNIPVYDKFEKMLEENNKAIVVTATGTGKSYLTLEYLERHDKNALVVVYRKNLGKDWEELSDRFKSITYHSFVKINKFDDYDVIVFDEVHHAGAATWELPIQAFIDQTDKKVIGLTADPRRWSEGARDIGEVLFEDKRVDGYSLDKAIEGKILPKLTYVSALWDVGSLKVRYKDRKVPVPLMAKFNYTLEKRKPVEEILKERLPKKGRKGIIFVESIASSKSAEMWFKNLFKNYPIWIIHSGQSYKINTRNHQEFKSAKEGFMIAVDMYNEGLHAPGVNTIIMLRRTKSPGIFYQQMGRALHVGQSNDPIIFDFVCNGKLVDVTSNLRETSNKDSITKVVREISDQTLIYDYTKDILDVIEEINLKLDNTWTEEEDYIIRKYYPIEGKEIMSRFPDRTLYSVYTRAQHLGVHLDGILELRWTAEEDEIIRKFYPTEGMDIIERLPGRDKKQIDSRRVRLGIKTNRNTWTSEEDALVKKYYQCDKQKLYKILSHRTNSAIITRARKLGVTKKNSWTDEEIEILKKFYPIEGIKVRDKIKTHAESSISSKAYDLGLKYTGDKEWQAEEIAILKKFYTSEGNKKIKKRLKDRSIKEIKEKSLELGLERKSKAWTPEEDEILKQYYSTEGGKVSKRIPGRSAHACTARAYLLSKKDNMKGKSNE